MKNTDYYLELALTALAYILPIAAWGGVLAMCWGAFIATMGAQTITGIMRGGILVWALFKLEYVFRPKGSIHIYDELKAWFAKDYIEHPFFEYFKAMVDTYELNAPEKGETWKTLDLKYLINKLDNNVDCFERGLRDEPHMVHVGNYSAMLHLRAQEELKA